MIDEITFIVKDIVNEIDNTIDGTYNIGLDVTEFCNTKWLRKGKNVTDELSNEFQITEIVYDENVSSNPLTAPLPKLNGITTIPAPFFITGTKLATNMEWTIADNDVTAKTPIVWLLETIRERKFGKGSVYHFEAELRIFFLDETNIAQFLTEDHRREVVYPMTRLAEEFIDMIGNNRKFKTIEDYTIKTFSRFGVEQDNGMFQNVLDANLSGVELQFTLTKFKENCKNC